MATTSSFGESVKEGVIVRWMKKAGDYVRADEDLVEIETEKATSAIPARTLAAFEGR